MQAIVMELIVVEIIVVQIQVEMFLPPYVDIMMAASDVAFAVVCAAGAICDRCLFWGHLLRSARGLSGMKGPYIYIYTYNQEPGS